MESKMEIERDKIYNMDGLESDKIYNMDCLEGMRRIKTASIDAIICDLPYGTIQGTALNWRKPDDDKCLWDEVIPSDQLFEQYERVLRRNGTIILFSQVPYTNHLRTIKAHNIEYLYPMYWKKEHAGNILLCKTAPLNYIEDINVYVKKHDSAGVHSLRDYSKQVAEYIGMNAGQIADYFREHNIETPTRAQHFISYEAVQYALCTKETYDLLIEHFGIDKMQGFRTYEDLQAEDEEYKRKYPKVFNLPEGAKSVSNVLEFAKDQDGWHPTQKPVDLLRYLIRTYSNEGDTILDNCMGSGTTAVACIKEKRHFIGFELNKDYYDKACKRIDAERRQLSLF